MEKEVKIKVEECHLAIFEQLTPFFGKNEGEVIKNLALRWVEANIANGNVVALNKMARTRTQ